MSCLQCSVPRGPVPAPALVLVVAQRVRPTITMLMQRQLPGSLCPLPLLWLGHWHVQRQALSLVACLAKPKQTNIPSQFECVAIPRRRCRGQLSPVQKIDSATHILLTTFFFALSCNKHHATGPTYLYRNSIEYGRASSGRRDRSRNVFL